MQSQLAMVLFFFFPVYAVILEQILLQVYLWQVKEYRFDRYYSFVRYDRHISDQAMIFNITKVAVLLTALFYVISLQAIFLISILVCFVVYLVQFMFIVQNIAGKKLLRPRIKSIRNLLILSGSLLLVLIPLLILVLYISSFAPQAGQSVAVPVTKPEQLPAFTEILPREENGQIITPLPLVIVFLATILAVVTDLLTGPAVAFMVAATGPLAYVRRWLLISKAKQLLAAHKNLKVVGITGSYGKSTTKELLYQILSKKFKTVKTPKNFNTDIGIAETIVKHLKKDTQVFIAEMGAYTKGEIRSSVHVAPPDISVVTAVGEQHLSLFGSMQNTFEAKYEIVEGLKEDGVAVLNGNNEYCLNMAAKTDKRTVIYFVVKGVSQVTTEIHKDSKDEVRSEIAQDKNIYATGIERSPKGYNFELKFKGKVRKVHTNLKAEYNLSNLLAAATVALQLGVSVDELAGIMGETKFDVPYLNKREGMNGSEIIDDGYNSNPQGFLAALDYLKEQKTKGKKWVISQSFIELGAAKDKSYQKFAKEITGFADGVITTDDTLALYLRKQKPDFKIVVTQSAKGLSNAYQDNIQDGDMVLLEGAMPSETQEIIFTHD